jgi:pyruvate/2-oxoglutarate dehydrogenase complex dihydrolipoamide acyltransferase (E2) component
MNVTIPQLGLTMQSATLVQWLVADGASVKQEEPIAEIATDKIEYEVVAPARGVITLLVAPSESDLPVGAVIATIK